MNNRIISIFVLIVSVVVFFVYINPTWTVDIATKKTIIANDKQALLAAKDYDAKQNELASAMNAIDPVNLELIKEFLPDSVDNIGLILDLNALAARSGLSLSNIDVMTSVTSGATEPSINASPISSVDLSISAVGTYTALQTFLTGVENSRRLLDVKDITVKGSDTGLYKYQMTLRLYWLH